MREIAETLARPKRPVNCMVCGETEHIEMDCPYLHGRARHVCDDDTCPAKYPSPCLCGNQPTHERDVCPFEPFDCGGCGSCDRRGDCVTHPEPLEFPIYIDAQGNEHGEF